MFTKIFKPIVSFYCFNGLALNSPVDVAVGTNRVIGGAHESTDSAKKV